MLRPEAPLTNRKEGQNLNLKNEKPVGQGSLKAGNGWQEVKFDAPVQASHFCLEALNAQDGKDNAAIAEFYLLDENGKPLSRQHWKIAYADSEKLTEVILPPIKYSTCRNPLTGVRPEEPNTRIR